MRRKEKRFTDKYKRIAACRNKKGLTQKELAQKTNIVLSTLRNYEQGASSYKREVAERIAAALEIDTRYLTYESNFENWKDKIKDNEKKQEIKKEAMFDLLACLGYGVFDSDYKINEQGKIFVNDLSFCPVNDTYNIYEVVTPDRKGKLLHERDLILFENIISAAFNSLLKDNVDFNIDPDLMDIFFNNGFIIDD